MKRCLMGVLLALLAGCASDPERMAVHEGEGSTADAKLLILPQAYLDEAGKGDHAEVTQLAPWVEVDRKSGEAGYMGLTLTRVVGDPEIFRSRAPRYLGVESNNELRISVGNATVVLHAMEVSKRWHKNKVDAGGFRTTAYFEQVRYRANPADMALLAKGPITRVSAAGTKGGTIWPRQERKILPDYQMRFNTFYQQNIATIQ